MEFRIELLVDLIIHTYLIDHMHFIEIALEHKRKHNEQKPKRKQINLNK